MVTAHMYTDEEVAWLTETRYSYASRNEQRKAFNERFKLEVKQHPFEAKCNSLGLTMSHDQQRLCRRINCHKTQPIGSEKISKVAGVNYVYVKIDDKPTEYGNSHSSRKNWKLKHHLVWEKAHGPIPKGYTLVFLNQNTLDVRLENLYLVPLKFMSIMNNYGWFSTNPEITLTGLKWCELYYLLKDRGQHGTTNTSMVES